MLSAPIVTPSVPSGRNTRSLPVTASARNAACAAMHKYRSKLPQFMSFSSSALFTVSAICPSGSSTAQQFVKFSPSSATIDAIQPDSVVGSVVGTL